MAFSNVHTFYVCMYYVGLRLFTYPNSPKSPKSPKCTFLNWESWGRQKAKWLFTYPNSPKFTFFNFILGVGKKPSGFLPTPTLPNSLFSIGRLGVGLSQIPFFQFHTWGRQKAKWLFAYPFV